jgi:NadR type nicotinamide-nucleotide adenylyltransferase
MFKIVITGPESTGKSSIAKYLAAKLKSPVAEEYAVEYLTASGGKYGYSDLMKIAWGQIANEDKASADSKSGIVICDTDLITIKIWSQVRFSKVHKKILSLISSRHYDHYILCAPDIDWEEAPFRENPDDRDFLFSLYRNELDSYGKKYDILTGNGKKRQKNAINILENIFKMHNNSTNGSNIKFPSV